ncbi:MAG: hypothetical protein IMZ61_03345, partial [Planctomycetes bacterium]|nr:hypothetical protein [Planctomycetota bacterium]
NFTDWEEPFLQLLKEAIQIATGEEPKPLLMPYATDERVFRKYGIPAASCGPKDYGKAGHGMAGPDEHILINEYLQVVRVFGLTTAAFCRAHVPENKGRI